MEVNSQGTPPLAEEQEGTKADHAYYSQCREQKTQKACPPLFVNASKSY